MEPIGPSRVTMNTMGSNKSVSTPGVVGTRVFENPWPITATGRAMAQQTDYESIASGASLSSPCTDNREHIMAPESPHRKPSPAGIGITRLAGNQRLNSPLFPPGPQKAYYRKNSLLGVRDTNIKPLSIKPVSEPHPDTCSEPPTSVPTSTRRFFEEWRTEKDKSVTFNKSEQKDLKSREDSDDDDSGGVTLAASLAVFMQTPGAVKLALCPIVQESDRVNQQHNPEQQESAQQEREKKDREKKEPEQEKAKTFEPPPPKPRSQATMASKMAALLQTPGALNFGPRRSVAPAPPVGFPTPVYYASPVEEKWERGEGRIAGEKREGHEGKRRIKPESAILQDRHIFDESNGIPWPSEPQIDNHDNLDTTRCWRTPGTSFVYLRSAPSQPATAPEQIKPATPERRTFRCVRDGDIVGHEASELPKSNKGRLMMEKMGYKDGTPLGINGDGGLMEPVKVEVRLGNRGLGLTKQEPGLPMQANISQVNPSQIAPIQILPATMNTMNRENNPHQTSYGIAQQFQNMGITTVHRSLGYSLATPIGAYQTRLRMVQELSYLDVLELLDVVDYNYILAVSMDRFAEDQLRTQYGFLMEADLARIVTREYKMAVLRKDQQERGSEPLNYAKMNKDGRW